MKMISAVILGVAALSFAAPAAASCAGTSTAFATSCESGVKVYRHAAQRQNAASAVRFIQLRDAREASKAANTIALRRLAIERDLADSQIALNQEIRFAIDDITDGGVRGLDIDGFENFGGRRGFIGGGFVGRRGFGGKRGGASSFRALPGPRFNGQGQPLGAR